MCKQCVQREGEGSGGEGGGNGSSTLGKRQELSCYRWDNEWHLLYDDIRTDLVACGRCVFSRLNWAWNMSCTEASVGKEGRDGADDADDARGFALA